MIVIANRVAFADVAKYVGARFSRSPHAEIARQRDQKRDEGDREREQT